jgi:hypothetical protein
MVDNVSAASPNALAAAGVYRASSNAGRAQNTAQQQQQTNQPTARQNGTVRQASAPQATSATQRSTGIGARNQLSEAQRERVQELQQRDREVRRHERAHQAAGGSVTGAAQFTYTQGPDGQRYAIAGEVSIDTSTEDNPRDTIAKMQTVIRAALAPAEPSSQDQQVAAQARAQLAQAQQQLSEQQTAGGGQQGQIDGSAITIAQGEGSRETSQTGNQQTAVQAFEQTQARADANRTQDIIRTTA